MLKKLRVKNFKCFKEAKEFDFGRITLLLGANSSGKSSVMYAVLGAIQSGEFPFQFSPNGKYVNMGDYRDMVWGNEVDREIEIGLDLEFPFGEIRLNSTWLNEARGLPRLKQLEIDHPLFESEVTELIKGEGYSLVSKFKENSIAELMPESFYNISSLEALSMSRMNARYHKVLGTPIVFELKDLGAMIQFESSEKYKSTTEPRKLERLEEALRKYLADFGKSAFQEYNFISSFRLHPERTYYESTKSDLRVEKFGEGYLDQIMLWDAKYPEKIAGLLLEMQEMDLIADLKANRLGGGRYDVQVKTKETGVFAALSDVGFGLSQFLPVLVADIQLGNESTLFVQQPESQLHPSVQANFGDYLTKRVTETQKNYVVETHSEYLLNRIRLNIVKGLLKPEDLQVYFLESEADDTAVHKITFTTDGKIEGAPENFFKTYFIDVMDIAIHAIPE